MKITCSKCGFSQPSDRYCAKCGLDMHAYEASRRFVMKKWLTNPLLHVVVFTVIATGLVTYKMSQEADGKCTAPCLRDWWNVFHNSLPVNKRRVLSTQKLVENHAATVATDDETVLVSSGSKSPRLRPSFSQEKVAAHSAQTLSLSSYFVAVDPSLLQELEKTPRVYQTDDVYILDWRSLSLLQSTQGERLLSGGLAKEALAVSSRADSSSVQADWSREFLCQENLEEDCYASFQATRLEGQIVLAFNVKYLVPKGKEKELFVRQWEQDVTLEAGHKILILFYLPQPVGEHKKHLPSVLRDSFLGLVIQG